MYKAKYPYHYRFFLVTTETGSEYVLDFKRMLWNRMIRTERSGRIRQEGGTMISVNEPIVGHSLYIEDTEVREGMDFHYVITSPVRKVETYHRAPQT